MNRRGFLTGGIALIGTGVIAQVPDLGLIFVGASWCPVCKRAAPVLALAVEQLGIPLLVASQDNRPIAPFSSVIHASDHPIARSIRQLPTTLIYSANTDEIVTAIIGYRNPQTYLRQITNGLQAAGKITRG